MAILQKIFYELNETTFSINEDIDAKLFTVEKGLLGVLMN
jgi:hypothetical protein